jgi:hypothetical protein
MTTVHAWADGAVRIKRIERNRNPQLWALNRLEPCRSSLTKVGQCLRTVSPAQDRGLCLRYCSRCLGSGPGRDGLFLLPARTVHDSFHEYIAVEVRREPVTAYEVSHVDPLRAAPSVRVPGCSGGNWAMTIMRPCLQTGQRTTQPCSWRLACPGAGASL